MVVTMTDSDAVGYGMLMAALILPRRYAGTSAVVEVSKSDHHYIRSSTTPLTRAPESNLDTWEPKDRKCCIILTLAITVSAPLYRPFLRPRLNSRLFCLFQLT